VGDPLYGEGGLPLPHTHAVPGDGGYRLHAMELAFRHPRLGHAMRVHALPPEDLRSAQPF
jgi:23S rRNA pseudouridine1911/1915/1917 synthase